MTGNVPRVTVLLPVFNGAATLRDAVNSVLAQTFMDFELLVVDDASTDESGAVLASYADKRLRVIRNPRNLGLPATLNRGLDMACGEYVARMDADDLCLPTRLEKQIAFMDARPEVGISGTGARAFGEASFPLEQPEDDAHIKAKLLFDSAINHPTAIFRKALLDAHGLRYPLLPHFEDYLLWQKTARVLPLANLSEELLRYRVSASSRFYGAKHEERMAAYTAIDRESLAFLSIQPTPSDLSIHSFLRRPEGARTDEAEAWLARLTQANDKAGYYDRAAFADVVRDRWFLVCYLAPGNGVKRWRRYTHSPLYRAHGLNAKSRVKVCVKFAVQRLRGQ